MGIRKTFLDGWEGLRDSSVFSLKNIEKGNYLINKYVFERFAVSNKGVSFA